MRVLALFLLFVVVYAKHEQYIGWKSYFIKPTTQSQLEAVRTMANKYELDILSHPLVEREGVIMVRPEHQDGFTKELQDLNVGYRPHSEDVKNSLDFDDQLIEIRKKESMARNNGRQLPYDNYQELEVIYDYIEDIASRYPDTVKLVVPADSFEGRPIKYLKISTTNFEDESKPVIFIDGGIHAREWISPPSVTWAIHKLVENVTDPDLLENFDWILLPVVNPDGYKFTFTTTRFWRKTRSTDQHGLGQTCPGVDGNRNFDFFWDTVGTSANPCAETFAGSRPFSEIEIRVIRDIFEEYLPRIPLYLNMHSFGSMVLYSWAHNGSLSSNGLTLHMVGIAMADAIQAVAIPYFPNYSVGNFAHVLGYPAAGTAQDYAITIGIPLAYTYELPGLSSGLQGFHLPPQYIQQVVKETWEGIKVGVRRAGEIFRSRE